MVALKRLELMLKHRNRSLEGLDEYASVCFQSICSFVLSVYSDNAEYELDELVNAPALPPLPEKDDVPVPEFDAIAHLIPEKQRMFLKVHQKEGVAFMHKRIIAVPEDHRGCILAHSMGLGKTFQAIVFTRLFFSLDCGRTALVIAPKRSVTPSRLTAPRLTSVPSCAARSALGSASSLCGPPHCARAGAAAERTPTCASTVPAKRSASAPDRRSSTSGPRRAA